MHGIPVTSTPRHNRNVTMDTMLSPVTRTTEAHYTTPNRLFVVKTKQDNKGKSRKQTSFNNNRTFCLETKKRHEVATQTNHVINQTFCLERDNFEIPSTECSHSSHSYTDDVTESFSRLDVTRTIQRQSSEDRGRDSTFLVMSSGGSSGFYSHATTTSGGRRVPSVGCSDEVFDVTELSRDSQGSVGIPDMSENLDAEGTFKDTCSSDERTRTYNTQDHNKTFSVRYVGPIDCSGKDSNDIGSVRCVMLSKRVACTVILHSPSKRIDDITWRKESHRSNV